MSTPTARRFISTTEGSNSGAFAPVDWGLVAGVAAIWGSSFLFIEIALESLSPGLITWSRILTGFLTLSLFPAARRPIERAAWPRIVLLSVTWTSFPFLLFPIAQQYIDSALTGMLNALVPIFAASIAAILLRRLPRRVQVIGLGVGLVGAVLISLPPLKIGGSTAFGVTLIVLATVSYGVSINIAVPLQQAYGAPAVMFRSLAISAISTFPFAISGLGSASWDISPLLAIAVLGPFGTGIAFIAMAQLVGRVGPTRGGLAIFFIPIVSIILGVMVRSETVEPIQLFGTALILTGAAVASRREK